jgi:hypothetical protein
VAPVSAASIGSSKSMKPTIDVLFGNPLEHDSEREFLARIRADLVAAGESAIILANFSPPSKVRQVDFLVVTTHRAVQIELKHLTAPVRGGVNGVWHLHPTGQRPIPINGNPYNQALEAKFAISDELRRFAQIHTGLPTPPDRNHYRLFDCVVCVYPELLPGSTVPSDHKVQVRGYPALMAKLMRPEPSHRMTFAQWKGFASHMGLYGETDIVNPKVDASAALTMVDGYIGRFRELAGLNLHELVSLSYDVDGESVQSSEAILEKLKAGQNLQIIGRSGSGKTHLSIHSAIQLIVEGRLPILLHASAFDGDFARLLERGVAGMHREGHRALMQAAEAVKRRPLLVVDGWNGCPDALCADLIQGLAEHVLNHGSQVVITTQVSVDLPLALQGVSATAQDPGPAQRDALLSSYSAPPAIGGLADSFSTPFDLSIAAECAQELPNEPTRADLIDAFLRHRLDHFEYPTRIRQILRVLANTMDERLTTSLPLGEAARIAEGAAPAADSSGRLVDDALASKVVRAQQGLLTFAHESIGRFLVAEDLFLRLRSSDELVKQLARPRHADLMSLVIPLETDPEKLVDLVRSVTDVDLLVNCVRGELGLRARNTLRDEVASVMNEAHWALAEMTVALLPPSMQLMHITHPRHWTPYEVALLSAIGAAFVEGHYLDEVRRLVDATDAAVAKEVGGRWPRGADAYIQEVYVIGGPRDVMPAAGLVVRAAEWGRGAHIETLNQLVPSLTATSYGLLYLVAGIMRLADRGAETILPGLLRLAWETRVYHVRLQTLVAVQNHNHAVEGALREEIEDILRSLETKNLMLSTALVDTLAMYGILKSGTDPRLIVETIRSLLQAGFSDDANDQAYSTISMQFEEVFAEEYGEALAALTPDELYSLHIMAALAPHAADGFFADYILRVLVREPRTEAIPALRRWAADLKADSFMVQNAVQCYLLALRGLAQFEDSPPKLVGKATDDLKAWHDIGEIVFWMSRPDGSSTVLADRCAPLWHQIESTLALAAADVLYQIQFSQLAGDDGTDLYGRLMRLFSKEMRVVAELGLKHSSSLTSLFRIPDAARRRQTLIQLLGKVGDVATLGMLEALTEDPATGADAIVAIREIKGRLRS